MECPKKEYYFVSNLTDSHEYEYIKPIGEFLVEFLNADLDGYDELLKRLYDVVFETEIFACGLCQSSIGRNRHISYNHRMIIAHGYFHFCT